MALILPGDNKTRSVIWNLANPHLSIPNPFFILDWVIHSFVHSLSIF